MSGYFRLPNPSDEEVNSEKITQNGICSLSHKTQYLPWILCGLSWIFTVIAILYSILRIGDRPVSQQNAIPKFSTDLGPYMYCPGGEQNVLKIF
jgi:hypothetical protein